MNNAVRNKKTLRVYTLKICAPAFLRTDIYLGVIENLIVIIASDWAVAIRRQTSN